MTRKVGVCKDAFQGPEPFAAWARRYKQHQRCGAGCSPRGAERSCSHRWHGGAGAAWASMFFFFQCQSNYLPVAAYQCNGCIIPLSLHCRQPEITGFLPVTSRHVTSRHVTSRHVTSRHLTSRCLSLPRRSLYPLLFTCFPSLHSLHVPSSYRNPERNPERASFSQNQEPRE